MMDYSSMLMIDEATAYTWHMHPYLLCPISYEHGIFSPAPPMIYKTSMGWGLFAPTLWFGHLHWKLDEYYSPFLPACIWQILPSLHICLLRTAHVPGQVCLTHSLLSQAQLQPPNPGLPPYKPVLTSCIACLALALPQCKSIFLVVQT
jgi:hypothetical protein